MTRDFANLVFKPAMHSVLGKVTTEEVVDNAVTVELREFTDEDKLKELFVDVAFFIGQRGGNQGFLKELKGLDWEVTENSIKVK